MSKLDATLQQALTAWRAAADHARTVVADASRGTAIDDRRVAVIVTHVGDLAPLRAAGLDTGSDLDGVVSGHIFLRDVATLAALPEVIRIVMEPTVRIMLDGTVKEMRVPWKVSPGSSAARGAGVIVAVIDTGIDIFHDSFHKVGGNTRILELWDQAATTGGAAPPAGFMQIGRVYNEAAINAGITASPPFASVDTNGHGTHVAGIAAGNGSQDDRCTKPGRYVGVAPEADLIVVKAIALPPGSTSSVSDALRWCAQARTRLPGNKPVVINCSFGSDIGPHDGHGGLDGLVDGILRPAAGPLPPGIAIVVAAGNAGDLDIHESGVVASNGSSTTSFSMPEGSLRSDTLDLWYTGASTLDIEIVAPPNPAVVGANTTGRITPVTPGSPFTIGLMTVTIVFQGPFPANRGRKQVNVVIAVAAGAPAGSTIRSGVWQLKLSETAGTAAVWDAWFASAHGDGFPVFRMEGDAAHTPRRRENTIGEPGMSANAITVASYDDGDGKLADSSSRGPDLIPPALPAGEYKPTIAAPGVGVRSARSRGDPDQPSSCCDQKTVDKDGTSMASPHVAGVVALIFQKNASLTFEQARAHLQRAARIDGIPAGEVPPIYDAALNIRANGLWGAGKLDAAQALADIPQLVVAGGGGGVGGVGGGGIGFMPSDLGYTPHDYLSRLGEWRMRFGPRPGLMLFAHLVSEHVDEVLRLINTRPRVGTVWRRHGGHLLVRRLLNGPSPQDTLLPTGVAGCDIAALLPRFFRILDRYGSPRLKADIVRFRSFVEAWPDADLQHLDDAALRLAAAG